jgi:RHS repeat-associated protein
LFYLGVVGDGSGGTLASYAYDPFGNTTVTSGSSTNPCEYTGRENDGTGLQFSCARYYSPTLMNSDFISFQYDPFGRRTGKTVAGITTNYLYDGVNVAQEISGGSPIANLLSGRINQAFTRTDSNGTANLLTDALGSTLALTDSSGNSLAQYAYEPFGNTSLTSGSSTNEFEYTGRENDGTGLYYNRARFYNPSLQRFISEDPLGLSAGPNFYAYAGNNPITRIDPFGLDWQIGVTGSWTVFGLTVGVGGGGTVGISTNGTLSGTSFFASEQANGMVGLGVYAGAGLGISIGHTKGPLTNSNGSGSVYAEADAGYGPSAGVSGSYSPSSGSATISLNKGLPGAGVGVAAGVGGSVSATQVSPTVGEILKWLTPNPVDTSGRKSR